MILPMKRYILLIIASALLLACTAKQKAGKGRSNAITSRFFAYYNTLFNAEEALNEEIRNRKNQYQDNFYEPYISIFTFENETDTDEADKGASMFMGGESAANTTLSILQISEAKALKIITKYSVMKNGTEKNKIIFDAVILLSRARLYQNKPLEALDALNYIFDNMPKDKRIDLAKIYQAQAFSKMGDYYRANEIFLTLTDTKKKYRKLKTIYYAQMLLAWGKKQEAIAELDNAFQINKNRELRSRMAFLRGQILASLGQNQEARESFFTAYKYASDFEFEVKSQIEIAKTFDGGKEDDYQNAKAYIENKSKKGTYASRKNEFLYALGIIAQKAGKYDEAQEYYKKALKEKLSDGQIRGLTFYQIAQYHFNKNDYISASAYYDSAISVMTYAPDKSRLEQLSKGLKKIVRNYYLVKKNDSVLALTKMSEPERTAFFEKYISRLKEKESKEEIIAKENERRNKHQQDERGSGSVFMDNISGFQDFGANRKGFYFANQTTVAKGQSQFRQLWGNRTLQDNWRYSVKSKGIDETKKHMMGIENSKDPRRFDVAFYVEKIPTDMEEIARLKKDRDTASLGLGRMYYNILSNTSLATKTLYHLVDARPEEEVKLQALHEIFTMNYEKNPQISERAKQIILKEFPYTPHAEFVKNPKNTTFTKSSTEVETIYQQVFQLYNEEKYEDAKALIEKVLNQYPQDALIPKFTLLNAYITGKTAGKEVMILQLEQIVLNYPKSLEGEKARDILRFIKSDLKMENTTETQRVPEDDKDVPPTSEPPVQKTKPRPSENKTGVPQKPQTPKGIFD